MIVLDLGDGGSIKLHTKFRQPPGKGVLSNRWLGPVAQLCYATTDDVLPGRAFGHTTRVALSPMRECSRMEHSITGRWVGNNCQQCYALGMPTRNVNLTDHFEKFITRLVAAGEYSNASEVVRDGLRLVEERKKAQRARLQSLRSAAKEGIDDIERGDFVEFDSDDD